MRLQRLLTEERSLRLVVELVDPPVVRVVPFRVHGGAGWLRPAQKSNYSKHKDLTFKLYSNHEGRPAGRPAPSPPGSGSGIRYIPTPDGADREGYYNPHTSKSRALHLTCKVTIHLLRPPAAAAAAAARAAAPAAGRCCPRWS